MHRFFNIPKLLGHRIYVLCSSLQIHFKELCRLSDLHEIIVKAYSPKIDSTQYLDLTPGNLGLELAWLCWLKTYQF